MCAPFGVSWDLAILSVLVVDLKVSIYVYRLILTFLTWLMKLHYRYALILILHCLMFYQLVFSASLLKFLPSYYKHKTVGYSPVWDWVCLKKKNWKYSTFHFIKHFSKTSLFWGEEKLFDIYSLHWQYLITMKEKLDSFLSIWKIYCIFFL